MYNFLLLSVGSNIQSKCRNSKIQHFIKKVKFNLLPGHEIFLYTKNEFLKEDDFRQKKKEGFSNMASFLPTFVFAFYTRWDLPHKCA